MKQKITLNQAHQEITIDGVTIPASISGVKGERICIFKPNAAFWRYWKENKDKVQEIAPSAEYKKIWNDDRGVIKKLGEITVWRNCKRDPQTKEYTYSYQASYDELKLFKEHEEKWAAWKKKNLTAIQPIHHVEIS